MAATILLDTVVWDLVLDINGNIALASDPYSQAQDAGSAIRLFEGELWYDTTQGVPYWQSIIGTLPPPELVKAVLVNAALTVPGVKVAQVFLSAYNNRQLSGQVQISDSAGNLAAVGF